MATALAQSSTETHFEVHALKNGRWMIEATSLVQQSALDDAKELIRHSDVRGVKVYKESTNHANGRSAAISIFSKIKAERRGGGRAVISRRPAAPIAMPSASKKPDVRKSVGRAATSKSEPRFMMHMVIATAVIMAVAAGVYLYTIVNADNQALPTTIEATEKPPWLSKPLK